MTRPEPEPYWQLVGPQPHAGSWANYLRQRVIIAPGPGSRIEIIRPFTPQYNWAEGSRAIEARRGAAKMRERMAGKQDRGRALSADDASSTSSLDNNAQ